VVMKDYYRLMGVEKEATEEEIKKAYRKLVMTYHPDRNPDDPHCEDRLKEINEAYRILSDGEKRQQYDLMRQNPYHNQVFYEGGVNDDLVNLLRKVYSAGFFTGGQGGLAEVAALEKEAANGGCGTLKNKS